MNMKYNVVDFSNRITAWEHPIRSISFTNGTGRVELVNIYGQPHIMIKCDYFCNLYLVTDKLGNDCKDKKSIETKFQWRAKWFADAAHTTAFDVYEKETIDKVELSLDINENI